MKSHVLYTSREEMRRKQGNRVLKFRFFLNKVLLLFQCIP